MASNSFRVADFSGQELEGVLARFTKMGVPYEIDGDLIRVPDSHASLAERLATMGSGEPGPGDGQPAAPAPPVGPPIGNSYAQSGAGGAVGYSGRSPGFPAGWYPLPDQTQERYWDGTGWTGAYRPTAQGFGPGSTAVRVPGAAPPFHGLAIASMVLGICSLVIWYLGIVTGVLGLIFGVMSLKQVEPQGYKRGRGMALAGIICSIVALAIWTLVLILLVVAGSSW